MLLVQLNSETNIATFVFVTVALKETDLFLEITSHVRILMNAKAICTIVVFMHTVLTPLALMIVLVLMDSMEMACLVRMLMNARLICKIAVLMHFAIIPLAPITVLASQDSKEMDCHAMTSMSVKRIHTTAMGMRSAKTP